MDNATEIPLPRVIFVSSSNRVAAWQLSNELADLRSEAMAMSFEEPLRGAILGTFFQCDPTIELSKDETVLPGITNYTRMDSPVTGGEFRLWFHHVLISRFGKGVLGKIMFERMKGNKDYFDTFIFADGDDDLLPDMQYIVDKVDADDCVLVRIVEGEDRKTFSFPTGIRSLQVREPTALAFLKALNPQPETAT